MLMRDSLLTFIHAKEVYPIRQPAEKGGEKTYGQATNF